MVFQAMESYSLKVKMSVTHGGRKCDLEAWEYVTLLNVEFPQDLGPKKPFLFEVERLLFTPVESLVEHFCMQFHFSPDIV